ncbi:hypothetical protein Acsp02_80300 [Actinoplanes sp. NBRC 103695]|nr:hypothetical protein Acsp02_80300 [Actinoplanes sp. NBRC 103695]
MASTTFPTTPARASSAARPRKRTAVELVAVGVVTDHQTPRPGSGPDTVSPRTAAHAVVAAARHLRLRQVVTYHRLAADSVAFAQILDDPTARPAVPVRAYHVTGARHGNTSLPAVLRTITSSPPQGLTVFSTAIRRAALTDVPADAVMVAQPLLSIATARQAITAARNNSSNPLTVLAPVALPADPQTMPVYSAVAAVAYAAQAIRGIDGRLDAALDHCLARHAAGWPAGLPATMRLLLPTERDSDQLRGRIAGLILQQTATPWSTRYAALTVFHTQHGHTRIPAGHRPAGADLAGWVGKQQQLLDTGRQPAGKAAALRLVGIVPSTATAGTCARELTACRAYAGTHGHLRPPGPATVAGIRVDTWLRECRRQLQTTTLPGAIGQALETIDAGWAAGASRDAVLDTACRFYQLHGHLRVPDGTTIDGVDLSAALAQLRREREGGTLAASEIAVWDALLLDWGPPGRAPRPGAVTFRTIGTVA